MRETRTVTLLIEKEIEVEIDDDLYESEPVWDGENTFTESYIDEGVVKDAIRDEIPTEIDGWRVVEVSSIDL